MLTRPNVIVPDQKWTGCFVSLFDYRQATAFSLPLPFDTSGSRQGHPRVTSFRRRVSELPRALGFRPLALASMCFSTRSRYSSVVILCPEFAFKNRYQLLGHLDLARIGGFAGR